MVDKNRFKDYFYFTQSNIQAAMGVVYECNNNEEKRFISLMNTGECFNHELFVFRSVNSTKFINGMLSTNVTTMR